MGECGDSWTPSAVPQWSAGRGADPGVLPSIDDHAWHDHGLFRVNHRALRRVWKLLPADPGRRGGHALPAVQHDVVLGHLHGLPRPGLFLLSGRRANPGWLDTIRSTECDRF